MNQNLNIVILAAGKGSRMKSDLPKVLQPLANRPLLQHCYDTANSLSPDVVQIIFGHGGDLVKQQLRCINVSWVEQTEQLGTGHAVQQATAGIKDDEVVLILYGDVPLLAGDTLSCLVSEVNDSTLALLTVTLDDPGGYGRIVRNEHGKVLRIVEHKDATDIEKEIEEINTGILAVKGKLLKQWLQQLQSNNAQGEYYLTDIIAMAVEDGITVSTQSPISEIEILGVNDKKQLAFLERAFQQRQAEQLMENGATLLDPARVDIRGQVTVGSDVSIDINVIFEGKVDLGDRVTVGANTILKDIAIGANTQILPNSILENATIGCECRIGPYARIRPGSKLSDRVHVGNFVELKKAEVAEGSKINHLSYVGDCQVGSMVNIGAGTITCNYDGVYKHKTIIEDNVSVGAGSQLVAPVTVKKGATIGAGSVITKEVPADQLTITRARQTTIKGWKRPLDRKEK